MGNYTVVFFSLQAASHRVAFNPPGGYCILGISEYLSIYWECLNVHNFCYFDVHVYIYSAYVSVYSMYTVSLEKNVFL